jgi:hypothetical protein
VIPQNEGNDHTEVWVNGSDWDFYVDVACAVPGCVSSPSSAHGTEILQSFADSTAGNSPRDTHLQPEQIVGGEHAVVIRYDGAPGVLPRIEWYLIHRNRIFDLSFLYHRSVPTLIYRDLIDSLHFDN